MQSTLQLKPLPADDDDVPPEEEEEELVLSGSDDGDDDAPAKPARQGRRKIKIEYIHDKSRRHITFSKRKAGIMKKAYELSTLTGTQVLLLVASETGHVYTFATPKLQPIITRDQGKNLIQACLNAQDEESDSGLEGPGGDETAVPAPPKPKATKAAASAKAKKGKAAEAAAAAAAAAAASASNSAQGSASATPSAVSPAIPPANAKIPVVPVPVNLGTPTLPHKGNKAGDHAAQTTTGATPQLPAATVTDLQSLYPTAPASPFTYTTNSYTLPQGLPQGTTVVPYYVSGNQQYLAYPYSGTQGNQGVQLVMVNPDGTASTYGQAGYSGGQLIVLQQPEQGEDGGGADGSRKRARDN